MNINIACSTDNNYLQHCSAMLCSLFENNKEHSVTVHLLHHGLSKDGQNFLLQLAKRYNNAIHFYDIDVERLGKLFIDKQWHPTLSIACYYRLLLSSLLDDSIEEVLYLDCDIIVLGDLSPLFKIDMTNYGVAAVEDISPENDKHRQIMGLSFGQNAFCSGVLLLNLKYWREHNSEHNLIEYAQKMGDQLIMEDQDVLNHEFRNNWFKLPYKYMRTPMAIVPLNKQQRWSDIEEYRNSPIIMHYASHTKPWLDISIPDGEYYWKYVRISQFPNPIKARTADRYRKSIRITKIRYYINYYIHPFIPDLLELLMKDVYNLVKLILLLPNPKKLKDYRIRRWLSKYGMNIR